MLEQTEISSLYENTCFRWGIQGRKNIVLSQYISNMNRQNIVQFSLLPFPEKKAFARAAPAGGCVPILRT